MDGDEMAESLDDGFKQAMRRLAGSVTIVTVANDGERHGTTATAVTSLSLNPPSLLACFNKDTRLHGLLGRSEHFCVNLLHADNLAVSKAFASPLSSAERFAAGKWQFPDGEPPYLADAQSSILCVKDKEIDYGSHTIFIGRVLAVRNRGDVSPLIYCNGAYGVTAPAKG
jgi:flavin reductase (DIM6/NTAB) family NADH-FMN oxidoreductase RutF